MKLTFTLPAYFSERDSDVEVSPLPGLNGIQLSEDRLETYFDDEIANAGVTGGVVRLVTDGDNAWVQVDFWAPCDIADEIIGQLRVDVIGQMSDGIGECGFEIEVDERPLVVIADTDSSIDVELVDDGTPIRAPSRIAIAAREGDLPALLSAIENDPTDVDRRRQGHAPLHLAIIYGHVAAVHVLLKAGADPNLLAPMENTPLQLCSLSNSLDDEQSSCVTRMLLEAGADPARVTDGGHTAKSYAEIREKKRTAEML